VNLGNSMTNKGSYSLLIRLEEDCKKEVGALGKIRFSEGFYVYNGSAFGPGGLKRVERHRRKSEAESGCHWHIDYLLTSTKTEVVEVFTKEASNHECSFSKEMMGKFGFIDDFGCSDCGCSSHLFYSEGRSDLENFIRGFYKN